MSITLAGLVIQMNDLALKVLAKPIMLFVVSPVPFIASQILDMVNLLFVIFRCFPSIA